MVQQGFISGRGCVVEFVDDHYIEVIRRQVRKAAGTQALDGGEDMLEAGRTLAADPKLTEGRISKGVPEGGQALVENFLAVGDEQQPCPREPLAQSLIVQRGHDRLASPGCRYQQVSVVSLKPGELDQLEKARLEWLRSNFDGA